MPTSTYRHDYLGVMTQIDDDDVRHIVFHNERVTAVADTKTGTNNPGWRDQIRLGTNATTNFDGVRRTVEMVQPGDQSYLFWNFNFKRNQRDTWNGCGYWDGLSFPNHDAALVSTAGNRALTKVLSAVREAQVQMSGPTFLGELRETVHMVRSPAKTLRDGVMDYFSVLKKRARGSNNAKRRILADTWLEYSFGWRPLFHDIQDGCKAYKNVMDRVVTQSVRASGLAESASTSGALVGPNWSGFQNYHLERQINKTTTRFIVGLKGNTYGPSQTLEAMTNSFGFIPSEFFPTAWELIPYSFLVDYFTNIGDLISAACTSTANISWICRTDRQDSELLRSHLWTDTQSMKASIGGVKGSSFVFISADGSSGSYRTRKVSVARSKPLTLGLPTLVFRMPGLSTKWINMAALGASHRSMVPYYR